MNNNKNLFYYGMWARIKEAIGFFVILLSFVVSFSITLNGHTAIAGVVFLVMLIFGIYIIISAKAQRFDYKMQSGTLIHQGEGRW